MSVPTWFAGAISDGLSILYTLNLPNTPAADVIGKTAAVWVQVLWGRPVAWQQERDTERIASAFADLARTADRWPAPKHLQLPDVPEPLALPPPRGVPAPPEVKAKLQALVAQMRFKP